VSGGIQLAGISEIPAVSAITGGITASEDKRFKVIRGIKGMILVGAISTLTLLSASVFGQGNKVIMNDPNNNGIKVEQVDYTIDPGSWENLIRETRHILEEASEDLASEFLKKIEKAQPSSFTRFIVSIKDGNFYRGYIEFQQKKKLGILDNKDEWHYYGKEGNGFFYRFGVINEKSEQVFRKSSESYDFASQVSKKDMWFDIESLKEVVASNFFNGYFCGINTRVKSDSLVRLMRQGLIANKTFINNANRGNNDAKISFDFNTGVLNVDSDDASVDTVNIKRDPYFTGIKSWMKCGIIYDESGSNKGYTQEQEKQLLRLSQHLKRIGITVDWITGVTSNDPSIEPFNESIISENLSTASGASFILEAIVKTLAKMSENKDNAPKMLFVTTKDLEQDTSKNGWAPVPVEDLRKDFNALLDNLEKDNGYMVIIVEDTIGHYGDKSNLLQLIDEYIAQRKGVRRIFYKKSKIQNMEEATMGIIEGARFSPTEILIPEKIKPGQVMVSYDKNGQLYSQDLLNNKRPDQADNTGPTGYSFSGFLGYANNTLKGLPKIGANQTATIKIEFNEQKMVLETDNEAKIILYDASGSRMDELAEQTAIMKKIGQLPGFSKLVIFNEEILIMNREQLIDSTNIIKYTNNKNYSNGRLTGAKALKQTLELAKKSGKPTTIYLIGDLGFNLNADIPTDLVEDCLKQGVRIILLVPGQQYSKLNEEACPGNYYKYIELITDFQSGKIVQREGNEYTEYSKYTIALAAALNSQHKGRFLYPMNNLKDVLNIIQNYRGKTIIKKFIPAVAYIDVYDADGNIIKKEVYKIKAGAEDGRDKIQEFENPNKTTSDLGNTDDDPQSFTLSLEGADIATLQQEITNLTSATPEDKQAALEVLKYMQEKSLEEIVLREDKDHLLISDIQGSEIGQIILPVQGGTSANRLALINLLFWVVFKKRNRNNKEEEASGQDIPQGPGTGNSAKGGIDFRSLPVITEPIANIVMSTGNFSFGKFASVDLDKEMNDLQGMVRAGIIPSAERIKDYIRASSAKDGLEQDMEKVTSCILEILRMEENGYLATDPALEDILAVFDAQLTTQELRSIFLGLPLPI
jgi:hypothetical protein